MNHCKENQRLTHNLTVLKTFYGTHIQIKLFLYITKYTIFVEFKIFRSYFSNKVRLEFEDSELDLRSLTVR